MGFLDPLFLVAAVAVAVPLVLHLARRHESRRVAFPALRYLLRTEREHARRIRLRQLLLLLLRVAVVLLVVAAGARLFLRGAGGAHEPTALAIVLDNSLSTSRVAGEERVLDRLQALALRTLDLAGPDDRVWVLRAAEPWDVATPGNAASARVRVTSTEPSAAAADLGAAVARAAALVRGAGLPAAEVELLSDLQASAFPDSGAASPAPGSGPRPALVVYRPPDAPGDNHFVADVLPGGGLPPLAGRRSQVAATLGGSDTVALPLRLVVDERIRAAATAPPGTAVLLPFGPFATGWVEGYVETDPDALRGDDRRWFALRVRPPPGVATAGDAPGFLADALAVLASGGRVRTAPLASADVVLAVAGEGAEAVRRGATVVVVPPTDPALLPALNRRLVDAGVPWRYQPAPGEGESTLASDRTPAGLDGVGVARAYRLVPPSGGPPVGSEVMARLADGSPWLVEGGLGDGGAPGGGRYRLLGSPLVPDATALPVSAAMVPFLEWLVTPGGGGSRVSGVLAGESLSLSAAATAVEAPDGTRYPVDGTQVFRVTRQPGIYEVLAGDSVLERVAVNPPPRESVLTPLPPDRLEARLGPDVRVASDPRSWSETVFTSRQGPELWRPLLLAALVLLLLEGWIAASGRSRPSPAPGGSRRTPRENRAPAA